jgi:hypothetical protein
VTNEGVIEFTLALRHFLARWPQVDTIATTFRLPDGQMMTVRVAGPLLELEDDSGASQVFTLNEVTEP